MEDGEGVSLSRVASRSSAAFVTMAGTLVRTEMDPVAKPRLSRFTNDLLHLVMGRGRVRRTRFRCCVLVDCGPAAVTVRFLSTEQLVEFTLTPVGCAFVLFNQLQQLCVLSLYAFQFGTKVRTDGLDFAVEVGLKVPCRFPARAAQGSTGTGARCGFHCTRMQVAVDRRAICGTRRVDVIDDLESSGIGYQLVVSSGCF